MSEKLWLAFDAPEAVLATVGGKGESLAKLARAGLPVPGGFHLATAAYRRFVAETGAAEQIAEALAESTPGDPASLRRAAKRIQPLFTDGELPGEVRAAIIEAYGRLGAPEPDAGAAEPGRVSEGRAARVAVRSSATAEDLPDASFAGQMESYLNVSGTEAVVDAVRRCWASLWTDRAIEYRSRIGIPASDVALAVVVQRMVDAEAAGVMFTANPLTGARDQIVVNAAWGLGESLVSGDVTPDSYTVANGAVVDRTIGDKAVETLRTDTGVRTEKVAPERRQAAVLSDAQVRELADIGAKVERLYGRPMDIEWAIDDGFRLVQARPITNLPEPQAERETWNDSVNGDYLWTSANLGEAIPSVMTPITWSFTEIFVSEAMAAATIGEHRLSGNIGGRFYLNLSMVEALGHAFGITKLMNDAMEQAFGRKPEGITAPALPMSRWAVIRATLKATAGFVKAVNTVKKDFTERIAAFPGRCDTARARINAATDAVELRALWDSDAGKLLYEGGKLLASGARLKGAQAARIRPWLRKYADEADTNALVTGLNADGDGLASLGPLLGLSQLAAGEIDGETFVARWGHRCPDEFEVSVPRPAEDPQWIERRLAGLTDTTSVAQLLTRQDSTREAALERFAQRHPRQVKELRRRLTDAGIAARGREAGRSEGVRSFWVLRAFVLRAGELTGIGDDVFFLHLPELLRLLEGDTAVLDVVARRRATYEHYRSLPVYPTYIRGRFEPETWAADPNRRTDAFDADGAAAPVGDAVVGAAGSAGVAEGIAVVLDDPEDGDRLGVGDILITKVTNIGWTPIFPRAAAVVTDVGAVLSHAAIVARELGIPAVVGCGTATTKIHSGDRVRVNGDTGTVEILQRAEI
ncbi:PEP/pyruvate-binding domain-containing protein [Stackebrandtia nassauensis]|uniref:Pyruvate phosphate dikinase PEP/pyruvate-binding protein n=1 Tax=Stackebrandtia nassauensis (strain DSM 44728 / CIP 108903 / NRRL B-16338 / NBRC 102104 / LLR-40K-21) TaxID=446470 RepID=D3QB50_STANL|nr:PEP/pyruvate-binding domain-containing protein [Stackebrandtia nassauensis]ADD40867.1 pyruvate phosphate dikinase PEP/pyruvate- binding protein [Stackebrandtia nassauensis DSM 44728]